MTDAATLQAAYAAKRAAHTGARTMGLRTYRVVLADGREVVERVIGLSQVAALYPDARVVERIGEGEHANFW